MPPKSAPPPPPKRYEAETPPPMPAGCGGVMFGAGIWILALLGAFNRFSPLQGVCNFIVAPLCTGGWRFFFGEIGPSWAMNPYNNLLITFTTYTVVGGLIGWICDLVRAFSGNSKPVVDD